jgi:hypothetical protein
MTTISVTTDVANEVRILRNSLQNPETGKRPTTSEFIKMALNAYRETLEDATDA